MFISSLILLSEICNDQNLVTSLTDNESLSLSHSKPGSLGC